MKFPEIVKGAIFDVDDTLLDNQAGVEHGTIHEQSRFKALLHVAEKYDIASLRTLTHEENLNAFLNAKVHSLPGAVWGVLVEKGIVDTDDFDPTHPLLNEIVDLKNELHADVLRELGIEVAGASFCVHALAKRYSIEKHMAIASSAVRRDINIFLDELTDLRQYFPDNHIVSLEDIHHGEGKPHPTPFNKAFTSLGLDEKDRSNVLAFEDDPRGIKSAKAAGLYVCAITTRFAADHPELLAAQPDMVIESYDDIMKLLKV